MGIVTKILNENFLAKSIRKITFTSMQTVESISAVFSQGSQIIYPNTSLESLKNSLTVTATYDDDSTREITGYTLTGSLVEGTSTITVSYEGCTTTFSVTVSHLVVLDSITAVFTQGQTPIYANTPLDSLKENLVVTANYDDGTHSNVIGADYNLVGTLQVGTSIVTVVYGGKTTTFEVLVSTGSLTVVSIDAVYTQGNTKVYETTSLNELKENLVVTATYTGGSTAIINDTDYTLSGTLEQGTSSIIVTYENQTDTFDVIVSGTPSLPAEYQRVDYLENTTYSQNNYIDTGVTIVPSTDKVINTFEITSLDLGSGKYNVPFGDWWAYRTKGIFSFIASNGNGYIRAGGKNDLTSIQLGTLSLNTPYTVSIYRYNATLNGTVISTGEDYGPSAPNTQLLFNTRNSSGAGTNESGSFLGKIYSHQIYRNDVLIHDFIPCYRKSDSKVGMYDMIASEFKPANGTIAKGPDSDAKVLESISAVYTQDAQVIYPDTTLDTLKSNLVVTATYDDTSTETIAAANYTLSGVLSLGTSTITATYGNKTATFTVNVTEKPTLSSISAVYTQGQTEVYPSTVLDTLKTDLVVTATYSDSSTSVVGAGSYTLTGTLTEGTSVITVTYEGQTTTFNVTVSAEPESVLPAGYQQVEYIANENTSSNPRGYIPLGITLTPSTDRVVTEFECTDFSAYTNNYLGAVYGDYWNDASKGVYNFLTSSAGFTVRAGGQNIRVAHSTDEHAAYTALPANTKHTLDVYHDYVYINGTLCGEPTGSTGTASNKAMYLFGSTNANNSDFNTLSYFKGKIYSHKIYRNDTLIHDYVPCYRLSDNVIGVYDVIDNVFKPATGTLSKGSDIGSAVTLDSISATYTQGQQVVYPNTLLNDLKTNLVVTANYSDSTSGVIGSEFYTLSGTLTEGTSTITVTYEGQTDTFDVTVIALPTVTGISAVYTQGATIVYEDTPIDSLKQNLVVTASYSDSSTATLSNNDYTLSGTLTEGSSTITATYDNFTDTFTVSVTGTGGKETETIGFCTAANITDTTTVDRIDNFVKTLKTENLWDKMDAIYPFIADTEAGMMLNLKDYTTKALVKQSSGSVSVDPGYSITCSGRPLKYSNSLTQSDVTNYGFSTSIMMDQTSVSNLAWVSTSAGATGGATTQGDWAIFTSSNKMYFRIGAPGGADTSSSNYDMTQLSSGGYVFTGSVVSGQPVKSYMNGTLGSEPTNVPALTKLYQNSTWYVNGGCVDRYVNPYLLRFCSFGKALTAEEASILDTAIKTLKPNKVSE